MRVLTTLGDAHDPNERGGSNALFLRAARQADFLQDGWQLDPTRLWMHRVAWNAIEFLRSGRKGGFQYSRTFLTRLHQQAPNLQSDDEIISRFQLFPPCHRWTTAVSFYIDATLTQLFDDYGFADAVSPRIRHEAIAREMEQYARAQRIVCMARWAAQSVVGDYGVPAEKVHVIPGGANLDESRLQSLSFSAGPPLRTVRLGFIGKQWQRKNLRFILDVADALDRLGQPAEVWAAGFAPENGPSHRLLHAVGFLDKLSELEKFAEFVRSVHFGALFSRAEAFGLSIREFIWLGVPVLTHDVGGIADAVPEGGGTVFPAGTPAATVAQHVLEQIVPPSRYRELRRRARDLSPEVTWASAVRKFKEIWNGSDR